MTTRGTRERKRKMRQVTQLIIRVTSLKRIMTPLLKEKWTRQLTERLLSFPGYQRTTMRTRRERARKMHQVTQLLIRVRWRRIMTLLLKEKRMRQVT